MENRILIEPLNHSPMSDMSPHKDPFLNRIREVIGEHVAEESFGVAELAEEMSMSRSTLLRKVKGLTGVSVAIFIRQQRLHYAKEMLHDSSLTISEVAFKSGFSSSSYFAKCFREEYGYTPGEEIHRTSEEDPEENLKEVPAESSSHNSWGRPALIAGVVAAILFLAGWWWTSESPSSVSPKTIAVLPFQNDSPDSNEYLINGFMVSIIDDLHEVEELQVTSRTTVERYRDAKMTVPELAEELGVNYFVEGSGQKIGEELILTLRLVDALEDTLIWAHRYKRGTTDIFDLQQEVSTSIAREVQVSITPEVQEKIAQAPTENLVAYDHFLRGMELIKTETRDGLIAGIEKFQKAIAEDPEFAHPHAFLAISYYFLDLYQVHKSHVEDINAYSDRAFLLDPTLNESLIGKGLYYMEADQFELAIQFFDKALANDPEAGWLHNLLSTIYMLHSPNTEEYLRHAIQGIQYSVSGQDSGAVSMSYLHLGNALTQNGFLKEAEFYVQQSLSFNPDNRFSEILSLYVELGQSGNLETAYQRIVTLLTKDSTFLQAIQEAGKLAYYQGDYELAWKHYERFLSFRDAGELMVYPGENLIISHVLKLLGQTEESEILQKQYLAFITEEESIYQHLGFAAYHALAGNNTKAMEYLQSFSEKDVSQYWMVMFIDQDPILQTLSSDPAYSETITRIQEKFWDRHEKLREVLEEEKVL